MIEVIVIYPQVFSPVRSFDEPLAKNGSSSFNARLLLICVLFFSPIVNGFDTLTLDVEKISRQGWQLNNTHIALFDLFKPTQQLGASIKKLTLPKPFTAFSFFDIQCQSFLWNDKKLQCLKGEARTKFPHLSQQPFGFSFLITEQKTQLSIQQLNVGEGEITIDINRHGDKWLINLKSKNLPLKNVHALLTMMEINAGIDEITNGFISATIKAEGDGTGIKKIQIDSSLKKLSLQARQGNIATDAADLTLVLTAHLQQNNWHWKNDFVIQHGQIYVDPVFLEIKKNPLKFTSQGDLMANGDIAIKQLNLAQSHVFAFDFLGHIKQNADYQINHAHLDGDIENLDDFFTHYLSAFFEQTAFEGILLKGAIKAAVDIDQSIITKLSGQIKQVYLSDDRQRFAMDNANAEIYWANTAHSMPSSFINWQKAKVKAIPIAASGLKFNTFAHQIDLLEPSAVPILGGVLNIKKFKWQKQPNNEPKVLFQGGIDAVSLEQLSSALNWSPLTGNITGVIPAVEYKDKTLTLNGGLNIKVFEGEIKINKLRSSGMFTDFPRLWLDMEFINLDLHTITQKIKMGGIEGRVSGSIKDMYLENWQPVTFYAWIGTPDDDDSNHRISQKAVENIASIGGGGAADVISKGFLRFFDTFGYDKLGFGCYLYKGVCQLMGVEAAEKGYYLIKGGGLPRIDVIGYNPRVNWQVLLRRLSRITATDDIVVE